MAFPTQSTFNAPPIDGSLTLLDAFEFNFKNNPDRPVFRYVSPQTNSTVDVTWDNLKTGVSNAAKLVRQAVLQEEPAVVGILSTTDFLTYYTLVVGVMHAGHIPFALSNRNSSAGMAHLLETTGARYLVQSQDSMTLDAVKRAQELFKDKAAASTLVNIAMPSFTDLYDKPIETTLPKITVTHDTVAIVLHSSGSTSFPKPIKITMRSLMEVARAALSGDLIYSQQLSAIHALPMFHLAGGVYLSCVPFGGVMLGVFPPTIPAVLPTPDRVWDDAIKSGCTSIVTVPVFLEAWYRNPERRTTLKTFDWVAFAGGPLVASVGDALAADGVNLSPVYGLTEAALVSTLLQKSPPKEGWAYWKISSHLDHVLVPFDEKEGTFKLVLKKCANHTPSVLNTAVDGVPALDTNDLVTVHPDNPTLMRVYGRADDQIILSNGEKTNPLPIEGVLCGNHEIKSAIMFGRGKFSPGVIITPQPECAFDPSDVAKLADFRNRIWETVSRANDLAPSHSRILKEMIIVANPDKPFALTPKGTPQRHHILVAYNEEINACYEDFERSQLMHISGPSVWDEEQCLAFLHRVINTVGLKTPLNDSDDIFQAGCDSLQATYIRNTLSYALRSTTSVDASQIPPSFVYNNPTISSLCGSILHILSAEGTQAPGGDPLALQLIQRHTSNFARTPSASVTTPSTGEVLLITGTTGGLGSYLLFSALSDSKYSRVYALNRPSGTSPLNDRQVASFRDKELDLAHLRSEKLVLLEADTTKEHFGLGVELYDRLREEVTTIIHNAWVVNFNLSLASLEPQLVSLRRLIDLAVSSKRADVPKFAFTSSISVFRNWQIAHPGEAAPETEILDHNLSSGQGYAESKWCAERILSQASKACPAFKPVIIRVGQLSGAESSGAWNTKEWFPSLVKSSIYLGSLPLLAGHIDWVPVDVAAKVILEVPESQQTFVNLVHPHPIDAPLLFSEIAVVLKLHLIHISEWIKALEASQDAHGNEMLHKNPGLKILDFLRTLESGSETGGDHPKELFMTTKARQASPSMEALAEGNQIQGDIKKWLGYWQRAGFI